jgi:hypothetical protein
MQKIVRPLVHHRAFILASLLGSLLVSLPVTARMLSVPPAVLKTPAAVAPTTPTVPAPEEPDIIPFLPTMDVDSYMQEKAAADTLSPTPSAAVRQPRVDALESVPVLPQGDFILDHLIEGINETESLALNPGLPRITPPDTNGAIGPNHFVEVVNLAYIAFDRETGERLLTRSLKDFLSIPGSPFPVQQPLTDPRVIYDRAQDRWSVVAISAFSATEHQFLFLAISTTGDPTGPFFLYHFDLTSVLFTGHSFDYPHIGMDKDAIIITANVFLGTTTFLWADMLAIGKDRLYNGLGASVPVFEGLRGTLTPPIVLDDNPTTFLLSNATISGGASSVFLYGLTHSGDPTMTTVSLLPQLPVEPYSIPPDAPQPGTTVRLDTLDTRFVHVSVQLGNSLFNVHTINIAGQATPRWYELNTQTGNVVQSGLLFATALSHDFNASLTIDDIANVFFTWNASQSESRANPGFFPQIWASARFATDPLGTILPGQLVFQSPTFYNQSTRWGDYSAMTLDPTFPVNGSPNVCAWGVNEKVIANSVWGSGIFRACLVETTPPPASSVGVR